MSKFLDFINPIKLMHNQERHDRLKELPGMFFFKKNFFAILLSLFLLFTPITVVVNTFIMLFLYKSLWSIIIGIVLVYLIVLFFALADYFLLKWVIPEMLKYKNDYFKFYNLVALIGSVGVTIYILIEVL